MKQPSSALTLLTVVPLSLLGCLGLRSGIDYPSYDTGEVRAQLLTPENQRSPTISLGSFKIKDEVCQGIDTHAVTTVLAQDDFTRFLATQGYKDLPVTARGNLYWFDLPGDGDGVVRLRLAVLDDAKEAADDLHQSLLQHGPGWWGLRRSNLAILAPKAGVAEAMAFALRYKLVCWGAVAMADADDAYVVPGPYAEL